MKISAFAAAFALLISSFATPVYASQTSTTVPTSQAQCEAQGFGWFSGRGCANRNCTAYGRTYTPGSTGSIIHTGPNRGRFYMCNGLTGRWVLV